MTMVSNFIGSLSPEMFGGSKAGAVQKVDLEDTTFSDMLEKQMNNIKEQEKNSLGIQGGFNIMDLTSGVSPQFEINTNGGDNNILDMVKPIRETDESVMRYMNNPKEMSSSEIITLFSSLFDSKPTLADDSSSGLFDFERKVAAGKYNRYAKNIVTDLSEFVTDTIKMKS